jgi:hypothetical protein
MNLLRCSDPNDLAAVIEFLCCVQVDARAEDDGTISASVPGAATALHGRREISGYIATWNTLNPSRHLELVAQPQPGF